MAILPLGILLPLFASHELLNVFCLQFDFMASGDTICIVCLTLARAIDVAKHGSRLYDRKAFDSSVRCQSLHHTHIMYRRHKDVVLTAP